MNPLWAIRPVDVQKDGDSDLNNLKLKTIFPMHSKIFYYVKSNPTIALLHQLHGVTMEDTNTTE